MKVLVAIALLSVASALPTPERAGGIDLLPLIVPKEVIEAVNNEAEVIQDDGTAVNFVDSAINEEVNGDDSIADKFVDFSKDEIADDLSAVHFVNNNDEDVVEFAEEKEESDSDVDSAVNFVESAIEESDGSAVNFVESVIEESDDSAVSFVESAIDENDGSAVNFVDSGFAGDDGTDLVNEILNVGAPIDADVDDTILISNVFEPISASELETIRIVDIPVNNIPYPAKVYDNPLLR